VAGLTWRRGGWELTYRDRGGRQRVERFPGPQRRVPPEVALDRRTEVERGLRRGTHVGRDEREATFGAYYAKWAASRRISATRAYTDESRARLHVLPVWRDWRLCDIRPSDIDDWVGQLSRQMGPWSVRHCYQLLRGPLRRAVKDKVIEDPCVGIELPRKPELRKTFDDVLTAREVDRLVAAVADRSGPYAGLRTSGRYAALVFAGAWLGPRWNEAIGLRVCDLNPARSELVLGRVVVNQNGARTFTERLSKTEDARTVPVPQPVMEALQAHQRTWCPNAGREDFLFLTGTGSHPMRSNFSRDVLRAAVGHAGLEGRRVTWLTLRHTAASLMFDAGLTVFEVQQRLGHKSPVMTAEIYTHLMRERFDEGRGRLERYMADHRQCDGGRDLG
jgi:integrase